MSRAAITNVKVQADRLWSSMMRLAEIGATVRGGVCRLALTDQDRIARNQFLSWVRELGCEISIDAIGNIVARRHGADPTRLPVMTGSHLDTQPTGGKFDGVYGVMAGLEVLRTVNDKGIRTAAPLELVVWTNEEGTRFSPIMMGSGVFTGQLSLDDMLEKQDRDGTSVQSALAAIGCDGKRKPGHPFDAYFEAHIEQGPILENKDISIGVVTGAMGQRWYDIEVAGLESHAGTTPMDSRRDALLAASRLTVRVNEIALEKGGDTRSTVGYMDVHPNSRNCIPGRVHLTVEFRGPQESMLAAMEQELGQACDRYSERGKLDFSIRRVADIKPQPFFPPLVEVVRNAALELGYTHMEILSGAGHDAVYMAQAGPAAMIFVPCKDGLSHNELEDAKKEDLEAGANVLLHSMLRAAEVLG